MNKRHIVGLLILAVIITFSITAVSAASATVTIRIEGMHCKNCAASIQKKLKATEGVEDVRVSFLKKEAWVKFDDQKISVAKLREVINSTGFKPSSSPHHRKVNHTERAIRVRSYYSENWNGEDLRFGS